MNHKLQRILVVQLLCITSINGMETDTTKIQDLQEEVKHLKAKIGQLESHHTSVSSNNSTNSAITTPNKPPIGKQYYITMKHYDSEKKSYLCALWKQNWCDNSYMCQENVWVPEEWYDKYNDYVKIAQLDAISRGNSFGHSWCGPRDLSQDDSHIYSGSHVKEYYKIDKENLKIRWSINCTELKMCCTALTVGFGLLVSFGIIMIKFT
jgi:hypothetical protein